MKKIVKTLTALLAAGTLSLSMFAFAACGTDEGDHTHTYGVPVWAWAADYETATATFTCSDCGDTEEITVYATSETTAATCTADGATVYTAAVKLGGKTYTDTQTVVLEATGHTYGSAVYDTESGNWYKVCSDCGDKITTTVDTSELSNYALLVDSASALSTALAQGSVTVQLTTDLELTAAQFRGTLYTSTDTNVTTVEMDLAGHKLTITGSGTIFVTNGKSLTITDSKNTDGSRTEANLEIKNASGANVCINSQTGSSITFENLVVKSTGCVLFPNGSTAKVNVYNSSIVTTGAYCIGTNATDETYYGVEINVEDSYLECNAQDGDSCPVMINVAGTLNIKNSEIVGQKQALIVRAGTATVENTDITCVLNYSASDKSSVIGYSQGGSWGYGNNLAFGAVVVGDTSSSAYNADAICTLNGCTISCTTADSELANYAMAIYATHQDSTYNTVVTIDSNTTITNGSIVNVNDTATMTGFNSFTINNTFDTTNAIWTYVAPAATESTEATETTSTSDDE